METRSQIIRLDDGARVVFQRAYLVVEAGPEQGLEYELTDRPVVIGRDESADLTLDDPTVSREHARIEPNGESWRILDLDSKSGVRVNGVKVEEAQVEPGFKICLGATELVLEKQEAELRAPRHANPNFRGILGESAAMRELFGLVEKIGPLDLPVLIHGESGTGKESLARALHAHGPTPDGPYVVVDCTLLGEGEHMRSELFGHVKGAFTGADRPRDGAFVRANGGTLFLDEVGELPANLQPQLLRVLQEGEVRPLGGSKVHRVRVRVVSATNRDLRTLVAEGRFRQDLFYRLSALGVDVPPLRARGQDALLLAKHYLPDSVDLADDAREALVNYAWPGNVRELEFLMQQAAALCDAGVVRAKDLRLRPTSEQPALSPAAAAIATPSAPPPLTAPSAVPTKNSPGFMSQRSRVAALTNEEVLEALARCGGNRNDAAKYLGVSRATLFRRLKAIREEAGEE